MKSTVRTGPCSRVVTARSLTSPPLSLFAYTHDGRVAAAQYLPTNIGALSSSGVAFLTPLFCMFVFLFACCGLFFYRTSSKSTIAMGSTYSHTYAGHLEGVHGILFYMPCGVLKVSNATGRGMSSSAPRHNVLFFPSMY